MDIFQTPALYSDDLSPDEWQARLDQMFNRAEATQQYVAGQISPADFEDALATYGVSDPYRLAEMWELQQICRGVS